MPFYQRLAFPLLRRADPECIHDVTLAMLELAQRIPPGPALLRAIAGAIPALPVDCLGLRFPNPLGIAAGFDKDARVLPGLALLGFGHVEVGTLTPLPQPGNPRPRIFRIPADRAIINRMGFPNAGVEDALPRLARLAAVSRNAILGVSIGKQKETPLERAADDYEALIDAAAPFADYLAVNVSSPNTPGLRELQGGRYLDELLARLVARRNAAARRRPLLVKIAPDLDDAELDAMLEVFLARGVDGVIATNTTLSRDGLTDRRLAGETGGLSGAPLARRATALVRAIRDRAGDRLPIIAAGGIFTADDARARLDAGASLLQVYTGLVYEGPGIAGAILRALADR